MNPTNANGHHADPIDLAADIEAVSDGSPA